MKHVDFNCLGNFNEKLENGNDLVEENQHRKNSSVMNIEAYSKVRTSKTKENELDNDSPHPHKNSFSSI